MIEAIILKRCFTMDEFKQFNQQQYSNYSLCTMDDNEDLRRRKLLVGRVESGRKEYFMTNIEKYDLETSGIDAALSILQAAAICVDENLNELIVLTLGVE